MAKDQDCFKIEKTLKDEADKTATSMGIGRSSLYRIAIIEYLNRHKLAALDWVNNPHTRHIKK